MSSLLRVRARRTRAPFLAALRLSSRWTTPWMRLALALSVASAAGAATASCEPLPSASSPSRVPQRTLAPYSGRFAELFDDAIEPRAVGLGLDIDATSTKGDPNFRERAEAADITVRARVSTVTGKQDGPETSYQVGFKVVEPIGGLRPLGDELSVRIDRSSPSLAVVHSFEGRLVGKTMIVFARAFARSDGEREIHVHIAPDTKEVVAAVHEAVILQEAGGGTTFTTTSQTTHSR